MSAYADTYMQMGDEHYYGLGGEEIDYDKACTSYSMAVDNDEDPRALLMYALSLKRVPKREFYPGQHMKWVEKAAASGDEYAIKWLETGESVEPPAPVYEYEDNSWMEEVLKNAGTGQPETSVEEIKENVLPEEDGQWDDDEESMREYDEMLILAYDGSAAAMGALGDFYMNGTGVKRSYSVAACWYNAAIRTQDEEMLGFDSDDWKKNLDILIQNGYDGDPVEFANAYIQHAKNEEDDAMICKIAYFWVKQAANAGYPLYMEELGAYLLRGRGCKKDLQAAGAWIDKAIENGFNDWYVDVMALAIAFEKEENYVAAKALYEKVIASDHDPDRLAFAELMIGSFYWFGRGVQKDDEKARNWFARSAQKGNKLAIDFIKEMDVNDANKVVCPWCGQENMYDQPQEGDLLCHNGNRECNKIFRYVDRHNSRRFGMEKCAPKPGVKPEDACPTCGGQLSMPDNIKPENVNNDKERTCSHCLKWDVRKSFSDEIGCDILEKSGGVVPGYFLDVGKGIFIRYTVAACPHCGETGIITSPSDLGYLCKEIKCRNCKKDYRYTGNELHQELIKKVRSKIAVEKKAIDILNRADEYIAKEDYKKAEDALLEAARMADNNITVIAQYKLGVLYFMGYPGVPMDNNKAEYWLSRAAKNGYKEAEKLLREEF